MGYIKCNGITNISAFVLIMESVQAKRLFIKKLFNFILVFSNVPYLS